MFFRTKCVPECRWSTSAVRRVRDGLVCGRIILGSFSDRFRIVNGVSTVFRACVVDRIPLWFATVGSFPHCKWDASGAGGWVADGIALWFATLGSFPHCKWDCKWCCRMSCRWSFEGSLARNAFLRDSRCTKPYVFPYKVCPRMSMIYLCGATGARRSRVWSDHPRIILGSVPHCKWGVNCFSCMCGRQNSIVICNCRIVPAL